MGSPRPRSLGFVASDPRNSASAPPMPAPSVAKAHPTSRREGRLRISLPVCGRADESEFPSPFGGGQGGGSRSLDPMDIAIGGPLDGGLTLPINDPVPPTTIDPIKAVGLDCPHDSPDLARG